MTQNYITLLDLPQGSKAIITGLREDEDDTQQHELLLRLLEIGFIEGEEVTVIAHKPYALQPIAVRVGEATFALRNFEAKYILVNPIKS